ncbi:MAG TPA: hypothetical protein VIN40_04790 [Candidatus Tyrphobacter sp.]
MKRQTANVRIAWGLCIGAVLIAYCAVVIPERREIGRLQERARSLYDTANRNERILAHAGVAEAERRSIAEEIVRLAGVQGTSIQSHILATLDQEARRFHVRVIALNPGAPVTIPARTRDTHDPLHPQDLAIELEGKFGGLVQTLADLTRGEALIGVRSITLNVVDSGGEGSPDLRASVTARAYMLDADWKEGESDASRAAR